MKASDDFLSIQGSVRTLVDSDGYLVYEDSSSGERTRYALSGETSEYQAGNGLQLSGNTFSIDSSIIPDKQEVEGMISSFFTNKQAIKVDSVPVTGIFELEYDPNYNVFKNEITLSSSTLNIGEIQFNDFQIENGETATFETWLTTTNSADINTISIDSDIIKVGEIPESLSGTFTHVFVRRIYKSNDTIKEFISYVHSF